MIQEDDILIIGFLLFLELLINLELIIFAMGGFGGLIISSAAGLMFIIVAKDYLCKGGDENGRKTK